MRSIVLKNWDSYSIEEKVSLLMHWFYYYGKRLFTLEELKDYQNLCMVDPDRMFKVAVTDFIVDGSGPVTVLEAMRQNMLDELFKIIEMPETEDIKDTYEAYGQVLNEELVKTYNFPQQSIPMTEEEIFEQITEIFKREDKGKSK